MIEHRMIEHRTISLLIVPQIRSDHLHELDRLADDVAAVEVRSRDGPDEFGQQGQERRDDVRNGQVKHVEVRPPDTNIIKLFAIIDVSCQTASFKTY